MTAAKKSPAETEAQGPDKLFRYKDFELEISSDLDDWPTLVFEAFSGNRNIEAVKLLFGTEKWLEFNTLYPRRGDFNDMMTELNLYVGITSGN